MFGNEYGGKLIYRADHLRISRTTSNVQSRTVHDSTADLVKRSQRLPLFQLLRSHNYAHTRSLRSHVSPAVSLFMSHLSRLFLQITNGRARRRGNQFPREHLAEERPS